MIKGIPYWGSETFNEMRKLSEVSDLEEKSIEDLGVDSIYTLFYELAKRNLIIRIKEDDKYFYSYVRDICFNYRDRVILIPYWSYLELVREINSNYDTVHLDMLDDNLVNIRHSFKLMYKIIDNRQLKVREKYIEVYDTTLKELYKIRLDNLPYITNDYFSIKDLHERYLNSAYYLVDYEDYNFNNRYHKIDREQGYNTEYKIRQKFNLKHFVAGICKYDLLNYMDFRHYKYQELISILPQNLKDRKGYWERKYLFEAYLYCIFAEGLEVLEEEYRDRFRLLGNKDRILKYEEKGIPMILKYYYKDNITLSKKSYEGYVKIKF